MEGIKNFESMGAPELHGPMMTWEDVQFARKMNKTEIEHCINQEAEFFDEKEEDYSEFTRRDFEEFSTTIFNVVRVALFERSIRSARNTDLWGQGVNPIGSSILTSEELSSIVARLIVKIPPRYELS